MAAPGFIISMHGISKDLIVAVGEAGLIARWNGTAWESLPEVTKTPLSCVFVENEIYACGLQNAIYGGALGGLSQMVAHQNLTGCVAKWNGRIWAGASDLGLCVLDGDTLTSIKPNFVPHFFDARHDLIMAANIAFIGTPDGENYRGRPLSEFAQSVADSGPPMW